MRKIRVLVACGGGIATSTFAADEIEKIAKGIDVPVDIIKHPLADRFEIITGRPQEELLKLIDIINRNGKHVWIRNVVVPDINDMEEDIAELNRFIRQIRYIDKVELLGYHTMAVNKYGKLGITYRLKGVPPMDGEKLNHLKQLVEIPETDAVSQVEL